MEQNNNDGVALKIFFSIFIYVFINTKSVLSICELNTVPGIGIAKVNDIFWYPEAHGLMGSARFIDKLIKQNVINTCINKENLDHSKCPHPPLPNHSSL